MTRIAVVTTVYNMAGVLEQSLASVREQTVQPAAHILCDDGSGDDALLVIHEHRKRASFPVKAMLHLTNKGHAAALNTAIRATDAEWIVKLDADDRLFPDALERIERAATDSVNVIYAPFQTFGDFAMRFEFPPFDAATMTERCQIPGPAAFRRSLWEAVGGFDETMRYGEDWDFWVRAERAVGLKPVCLPDPLYFYRTYRNWGERHNDQPHQDLFKPYWRGHHKDNIGTRTWASWLEEYAAVLA